MEESILNSVKKNLGLAAEYLPFDHDVATFINSALSEMDQLGVGPAGGLFITDETTEWSDLDIPPNQLNIMKTLLFLKARLLFDPPTTSFGLEAAKQQIDKFEWRINVMREEALHPEVTP